MTAKKETAGNREVWRSAATRWAALTSATTLHTLCAAAMTALPHSNGDSDGGTATATAARTTVMERTTAGHPPPPSGGTPTLSASIIRITLRAIGATAARCSYTEHGGGAAARMATACAI